MKGKKTGGRRPGSLNKRTLAMEAAAFAAAASGETPLEYMLRIMRDPTVEHERRDGMARVAARYVHPALQAIEAKVGLSTADKWGQERRQALWPDQALCGQPWPTARAFAAPPAMSALALLRFSASKLSLAAA